MTISLASIARQQVDDVLHLAGWRRFSNATMAARHSPATFPSHQHRSQHSRRYADSASCLGQKWQCTTQ